MNWYKLDKLYDLSRSTRLAISLRDFCNQMIHSFVFMPSMNDRGGLHGFFVASDRQKNSSVLYFDIDAFADALERVANDDIVHVETIREFVGGPAKVVSKSSVLKV